MYDSSSIPVKDNKKKILTLSQFCLARDPGLGTHSPAEHPYPLSLSFFFLNTDPKFHQRVGTLLTTVDGGGRVKCLPVPGWTLLLQQGCPSVPVFGLVSHTLLPSPHWLDSGALASSHSGAESNVTGPGCSVLPPPSKGPISAEGCHHPGSLGRE